MMVRRGVTAHEREFMQGTADLQTQIDALTAKLDALASKDAIRDCLYRINRGIDRVDERLLTSGFHPDAGVRWAAKEAVPVADWVKAAIKVQRTTQRVQHLIGNVLIELDGDNAHVESYEIGRHLTPIKDEMKDLIIAARYIDKFARRDGEWRIVRRDKVVDWIRIMEGSDPYWDQVPVRGRRDDQDLSFEAFRARAFHPRA
jgi:hypothetical protein